jgi:hypothetical protein
LCAQPNAPGGCNCDVQTDANCIDYVAVHDGVDANAPLIRRVSGDITDQINSHDSFTSTGRNMFVLFHVRSYHIHNMSCSEQLLLSTQR